VAWKIQYARTARKDLQKLDRQVARRIVDYLDHRVAGAGDPRAHGKALNGAFSDRWRYRVGDYRLICDVQDETITVLVLTIGHRKDIYE
jgi:mRNA interferase RelE/StbE